MSSEVKTHLSPTNVSELWFPEGRSVISHHTCPPNRKQKVWGSMGAAQRWGHTAWDGWCDEVLELDLLSPSSGSSSVEALSLWGIN